MIYVEIPGTPVAQGRPRFSRYGHAYDPATSRQYKQAVAFCARNAYSDDPLTGAISVTMRIYRPIQKAGSKKLHADKEAGRVRPTVKPDVDNVYKAVSDAMTGIIWHDDNQIVQVNISKFYALRPHVEVEIEEI